MSRVFRSKLKPEAKSKLEANMEPSQTRNQKVSRSKRQAKATSRIEAGAKGKPKPKLRARLTPSQNLSQPRAGEEATTKESETKTGILERVCKCRELFMCMLRATHLLSSMLNGTADAQMRRLGRKTRQGNQRMRSATDGSELMAVACSVPRQWKRHQRESSQHGFISSRYKRPR